MSGASFTWQELVSVTAGSWLLGPAAAAAGVTSIEMDSRQVQDGQLFLAFRGENHDSHDYVVQAAGRGAAAVCIDRDLPAAALAALREAACACLRVPDTLTAYQQLAQHHRRRFPELLVIAITGSCGKTSTKEIVAAVARAQVGETPVLATQGNTNNLIGVPRNLLRLNRDHRIAVLEVGTNAPGEIGALTRLVEPRLAILTNVGPVHLEGLGDLDGVRREKADIFSTLDAQGQAILAHELRAHPLIAARLPTGRTISVGPQPEADVRLDYQGGGYEGSTFHVTLQDGSTTTVDWQLTGRHQAQNGAIGFAVGACLGLEAETTAAALRQVRLPGMRMAIQRHDDVRWVNDAYNANPASMRALIDWLQSVEAPDGRLYLCLGDMLELGPDAIPLHRELLDYAAETLPAAALLPVGPLMVDAARDRQLTAYATLAAAREVLYARLQPGDTVVLKGSRGMRLEGLLPPAREAPG